MKIALLTIWHVKNYGAELQTYATVKALNKMGHDVSVIDIRLTDMGTPSFAGRIIEKIERHGSLNKKFERFWNKNIPATKHYKSVQSLICNCPEADLYMVGSDQVWNPSITKDYANLFFLSFVPSGCKKIAYSSSFGTEEWRHPQLTEEIKVLLSQFAFLSCRESSGVKILKDVFSLSSNNVLDPTLLFPSYPELTGKINECNTFVCYPLSTDPELLKFSDIISKQLGLKLVNNNKKYMLLSKIQWDGVAVEEWVKNIAQAKFVLTRSFHGVAFSILYNRQFAVVEGNMNVSTRIVDLLNKLGLQSRMFKSFDELMKKEPWVHTIDYSKVNCILNNERDRSLKILGSMMIH